MFDYLVSIMMPVYNADRFVGEAIESVIAQTYQNWELIIVNDGSTDNTFKIVSNYDDLRIKLINQQNGGESVARNTAIDHIKGKYLAFLDADDLYLPNHLEVSTHYLQTHNLVDGIYTNGYYVDDEKHIIQSLKSWRRGPFEGDVFEEILRAPDVFGPPISVILKVDVIKKHDLRFDPNIVIGPDWDFFTRYSANSRFGYVDEITCLYRIHQSNVTFRATERRARDLAKCRMKAIQHPRYNSCSIETKYAAFYDLLVNLLDSQPDIQTEITAWEQFNQLPAEFRARLFRLMASKKILNNPNNELAIKWLQHSKDLNPKDIRTRFLLLINKIHPKFLHTFLNMRLRLVHKKTMKSPFGHL